MSTPDYSAVVWPWDDDPNWAQPREGATYDKADEANWRLGCGECDLHFPKDIELGGFGETPKRPANRALLGWWVCDLYPSAAARGSAGR